MATGKILLPVIVAVVIVAVVLILLQGPVSAPQAPGVLPTDSTDATVPEANIVVFYPLAGAVVSNPLVVSGKARVFENQFNWQLKNENGASVARGTAYANAYDSGMFGDYELKIPLPLSLTDRFTLEVLDYSAKDGLPENVVSVPLRLASRETMTVLVYFNNNRLDPEVSCGKVFPVERTILKTKETALAALSELLKGATTNDTSRGYSTSLPIGVGINSITIRDGVAYADFNEQLEYEMGGSCRVTAIRAQINSTLKQFTTVTDVVISVNNRIEDILQP